MAYRFTVRPYNQRTHLHQRQLSLYMQHTQPINQASQASQASDENTNRATKTILIKHTRNLENKDKIAGNVSVPLLHGGFIVHIHHPEKVFIVRASPAHPPYQPTLASS